MHPDHRKRLIESYLHRACLDVFVLGWKVTHISSGPKEHLIYSLSNTNTEITTVFFQVSSEDNLNSEYCEVSILGNAHKSRNFDTLTLDFPIEEFMSNMERIKSLLGNEPVLSLPLTDVRASIMTDAELTQLHKTIHAEMRRRYPAGDWPEEELKERRAELKREFKIKHAADKEFEIIPYGIAIGGQLGTS